MKTASHRMAGKRVLVTGAGTGIGREIALEFARQGARVALHFLSADENILGAVREIESSGGEATAIQADFQSLDQLHRLTDAALKFLGGLDVLVNNAGITLTWPFEMTSPEHFELLFNVNVRAPYFLTQQCLPALVESRGSVVNIGSIHGRQGMPDHSLYAATKGAIEALSRELAIELALKGVRVNSIAPGCIEVEKYAREMPDFNRNAAGRNIPAGFCGVPSDVAKAAVFLASDDARFILGQTLVVDGGTSAWLPFSDAFRQSSGRNKLGKTHVPGIGAPERTGY